MSRLHYFAMAAALAVATPAFAQFGGTPVVPSDSFRPQAPIPITPRQPQAPAAVAPRPPAAPVAAQPGPVAPVAAVHKPARLPTASASPPGTVKLAIVSSSPEPTYDEGTVERLTAALRAYEAIEARGGWQALSADTAKLVPGVCGLDVPALRQRLAVTGDLRAELTVGDAYDAALVAAVKHFQARNGLTETGTVGPQTLTALNVPVQKRIRQISASLERIAATSFTFGQRYVVVNIPAAVAEAVEGSKVDHRYVAVVGKPDRPSPTVTALLSTVNLNPTWTPPLSILKKDIVPKMRKDPTFLSRMHMRLLDGSGGEIDPTLVDWSADHVPAYTVRQDPGSWNSLGFLRIDMPNPQSVYMHDTPHRELFSSDYRFHSSGCARIGDVRALAAWLLQDTPGGWDRARIDAGIATGQRTDIRIAHPVPVAWVYLTAWGMRDGTVQFRPDIYHHDDVSAKQFMASVERPRTPVASAATLTRGFSLQSAESEPVGFSEVSYLDSR
jgi:murein L,D-transpeptidase YcbB/YkuD